MNKEQNLVLLRGIHEKNRKLRVGVRDHFNSGKWDTEQNGKVAARLLDEIIDLATTARQELT
jgi:hypothetical protein